MNSHCIRTLAVVCGIGIIAATPGLAGAQVDTLAAVAGTEVVVSRDEVTVTFPGELAGGRADQYGGGIWHLRINDEGPPRAISLRNDPRPGRTYGSLQAVVSAGEARICWPEYPSCDRTRVRAAVRDGRVVLSVRDPAAVAQLFGLLPDSAVASVWRPGMVESVRSPVRVTYVEPALPAPDPAARAAAAEQRRRYFLRVNRAVREIVAERPYADLWLVAGDSTRAQVREGRCRASSCIVSTTEAPDAHWSMADSSVARVEPAGAGLVRVVALRPGRTVLRVAGLPANTDTVPGWSSLPQALEREVVVTLPIAAVRICPRVPVAANRPFPLHVEVVDSGGHVFRDPPIGISTGNGPYTMPPSDSAKIQAIGGIGRGELTLTAAYRGHADTLELRVRPGHTRSPPDGSSPDACSASAFRSVLPAPRPPEEEGAEEPGAATPP